VERVGARAGSASALVVLESVPALRSTTNPYIHQLVDAIATRADVELFSWRRALVGRFDVFHVHWPELLSRGSGPLKTFGKQLLTWVFQTRIALQRKPVVRTAHNVAPHESGSRFERRLLARWDSLTTAWVTLNEQTPLPPGAHRVVVPHGHYTDYYAHLPQSEPTPGRIAAIGQIRGYKGTGDLVRVFRELDVPDARLIVAGAARTAALRDELIALAGPDTRISLEFGFVDDDRLVEIVTSSSLIALPYAAMHNSGALILALSLRRPVLAPRNDVTDALAAEVGEEWVRRYDQMLTADVLADAVRAGVPEGAPDLSARGWEEAGRAHVALFEQICLKELSR